MTLGRLKNKISRIIGTSFAPKQKNKLALFAVIATKPVDIIFEKTIDNIKQVNQKYAKPQLYEHSDAENKTNDDLPLSIKTGVTTVCSGSNENWF